jgi:hypothetical protein
MERLLLPLTLLSCLTASAGTLPSPEQLFRAAVAVHAAQQDWKYTYREDDESFTLNKKGQRLPSKTPTPNQTFDVVMLEGEPYHKLVLIDGKPLDEQTQEQVNQDLERERAIRQQPKKTPAVPGFHLSTVKIEQLEQLFETKVTGEETVLGRKTWRLESVPRRNVQPTPIQGGMVATRVATWIDQQDGVEIKQTSSLVAKDPKAGAATELTLEFSKIGEAWLLDTAHIRTDVKIGAKEHAYREMDVRCYAYKRLTADSAIVTP